MKFVQKYIRYILIISVFGLIAGCATYYTKNIEFQNYLSQGNFERADNWLDKNTKDADGKNKLLYYLNRGYISWILQNYDESNQHFSIAENVIEDYIKNYYLEALTLISNPTVKPYKPEDFEIVMVNYFMALNYIQLGKYEDALVECKRINIKLNQLNDKYKDHKNKYQRDAFAHHLMGIIYEANKDYNNAFIAYRNALEIYETDYKEYFNISVPEQLKQDILRSAYLTGFYDDVSFYEEKFNQKFDYEPNDNGELIFFWLNGFGPYKAESSINFVKVPNEDKGFVTLVNDEYNLSFPLYIGDKSSEEKEAFEDLRFFRVAFPKYVERKPYYNKATLNCGSEIYNLELMQDINDIAFKTLNDRMVREIASAIMRLATKKALEALADEEDEGLGTLVNIVNTVTEKADTRNWQTLPYSISYARIPLKNGLNEVSLQSYSTQSGPNEQIFKFEGVKGKTTFHAYHTIASK
ncbi:COG3014 family protein [Bacteroidota bacterium]